MLDNARLDLLNRKLTEILNYNRVKVISDSELQVGDRVIVFNSNSTQNITLSSRTVSSR